jgi:O-antigen/teichoic acid export membrane protein
MTELEPQRIIQNTASYAAGNFLSRVFDVLTIFLLARYLGVIDFGKFSFAFAYVGLFSFFIDWGVNMILVREMARSPERAPSLYASGVGLKLVLAAGGCLASAGSILLLDYPLQVKVLTVIVSLNLLISFRLPAFKDVFEAPLIVHLRLRYSAIASAANRVITFLAVLAAILLKAPLWVITLVYTVISVPSLFLLVYFSRSTTRLSLRFNSSDWAYLLRQGFPLGLAGILAIFYARFDLLLISKFWSMKELGLYSAARRLTEPLELIPVALGLSILPVMSHVFAQGKENIVRLYRRALLYMLLAAIPIAVFLMSFAGPVVELLFGKGFQDAGRALVLLSFYLPFIFLWHMGSAVFIAVHKQKTNSLIWAAALVPYLTGNLLLIPRLGFIGASWVRLATGILITVLSISFVKHYLGRLRLGLLARIVLLAAPLIAVSRVFLGSHPAAAFLVFAIPFGAGLWALKIINREDARLAGQSLVRLFRGERAAGSQAPDRPEAFPGPDSP